MDVDSGSKALLALKLALQSLAADAVAQVNLYPNFVEVADELAREFDECWRGLTASPTASSLAHHQTDALSRLDAYIAAISGPAHEKVWTVEALSSRHEWSEIRELAKSALLTFGWANTLPIKSRTEFISR